MTTYTVYLVDYVTNKTEPIGKVVERRKGERDNNAIDLLKLAQKLYGRYSSDPNIVIIKEG